MWRTRLLHSVAAGLCILIASPAQTLGPEQRSQFLVDGWSGAVPSTEDGILKKFGEPQRITREHVRSRHDETETHEVVTVVYGRLKVKLYKTAERQIPVEVVIRMER